MGAGAGSGTGGVYLTGAVGALGPLGAYGVVGVKVIDAEYGFGGVYEYDSGDADA
jgi:hypothetical protein